MAEEKMMVSACLTGVHCVYDGSSKRHPVFAGMRAKKKAVLFCPEMFGGLKVPHSPSEISGGDGFRVLAGRAKVVSREGRDVTLFFLRGAFKTLALARKTGVARAILKARSPSCGCGRIYDGTFSKKLVPGFGVTAALLKKNGIAVMSDEEYLKTRNLNAKKK